MLTKVRDDLDAPQLFLGEAGEAADVKPASLKSWMHRGVILMRENDRDDARGGTRRLFTIRRVYQIALTARFAELGLSLEDAGAAALRFTDISSEDRDGGMAAHWSGEELQNVRHPGELFLGGETYLVVSREHARADLRTQVICATGQSFRNVVGYEARVVNVSHVVWGVRQRLGLQAFTVVDGDGL